MKNKIILSLSFLLLLFLGYYGHVWISELNQVQSKIQRSKMTPVIFVPGSSATINRFDDLFSNINVKNVNHSILKVKVNTDNTLTFSGNIKSNDKEPFIVIGFQDNEDGYTNIKKQAKWLTIALEALQERYHFRTFSAIGHSNGGLNWTIFFEQYYDPNSFDVPVLMTLGTPFNFSENSLNRKTEMLNDLISDSHNLPENLRMISVAGTEDYTDDGIVPIQSVVAGKYVYQKAVKSYTQITVSGDNAQHSSLPENPETVKLIESNILKNNKRSNR